MDVGPLASWVVIITQFVVVPVVVWLRHQLRAPLHRLEERMGEHSQHIANVKTAVEDLARHVARQNGRIGSLETRFSEHTVHDQHQQDRLHEDLRTLYLHVTPNLPKRE